MGEDMQIGHVYQYSTRVNDAGSTFVLLKIDDIYGHKVASISITGVSMKSKHSPNGISKWIGHLPISMDSLLGSNPVDTGVINNVVWPNDGYDLWMNSVKYGKAGFWTMPLNLCIDALECMLSK